MTETINISRDNFQRLGDQYQPAVNVICKKEIIDEVTCYWFKEVDNVKTSKILLYLHGGCFVLGSLHSHRPLVSHLTEKLELTTVFVEYSLAPENPFPVAVSEIAKVYCYLVSKYPASEIILMGDSAGAGLAISVLSRVNKMNIKTPRQLIMISPWIDLTCTNESLLVNAEIDPIITKEQLIQFATLYLNGQDRTEANPINLLTGPFPPTLILVGTNEILFDDSRVIYKKITKFQEKTKLSIYAKQTHVWLLDDIYSLASLKVLNEIRNFIKEC